MHKHTHELQEGDVVLHSGMRILLDGPSKHLHAGTYHEVWRWPGLVLNADELCDKGSPSYDAYIAKHIRGIWWEDRVPRPRKDDWPVQGNNLAGWVVDEPDKPFLVVTEGCDQDSYADPDTQWQRYEKRFDTEREAVDEWLAAKRYENTRPVAIYPEPDWSKYSYDGRTPIKK